MGRSRAVEVEEGNNTLHKHITNGMYCVLLDTVYYINYI
jgi:hypothetical protein